MPREALAMRQPPRNEGANQLAGPASEIEVDSPNDNLSAYQLLNSDLCRQQVRSPAARPSTLQYASSRSAVPKAAVKMVRLAKMCRRFGEILIATAMI
jgi:hypothetical protein